MTENIIEIKERKIETENGYKFDFQPIINDEELGFSYGNLEEAVLLAEDLERTLNGDVKVIYPKNWHWQQPSGEWHRVSDDL